MKTDFESQEALAEQVKKMKFVLQMFIRWHDSGGPGERKELLIRATAASVLEGCDIPTHTHASNHINDGCAKCGEDLRHSIHTRI